MSNRPRPDDLERVLEGLPRERASADFTNRVLARLEAPADRRRRTTRAHFGSRHLAAATAVLALLVVGLALLADRAPRRADGREPAVTAARAEWLRSEHRRLWAELEDLKAEIDLERPTLYLASDDDMDLVLEVDQLAGLRVGSAGEPLLLDRSKPRENEHDEP